MPNVNDWMGFRFALGGYEGHCLCQRGAPRAGGIVRYEKCAARHSSFFRYALLPLPSYDPPSSPAPSSGSGAASGDDADAEMVLAVKSRIHALFSPSAPPPTPRLGDRGVHRRRRASRRAAPPARARARRAAASADAGSDTRARGRSSAQGTSPGASSASRFKIDATGGAVAY